MKKVKLFLLAACALLGHLTYSQSVTFKPGPADGVDATILRNDICTNWDNSNIGTNTELNLSAWTYYAINCGPGVVRNLIRFDGLNTLPAGAVVTYAELRLFGMPTSTNYGNSQYPGSPYYPGNNNGWVRRVTSAWAEMGVTWNTQPAYTTTDQVATPGSNSQWNFNVAVNVTSQVAAMMAPGQNNGFMLMLDDENYYRGILFASSDHSNSNLWPELYVQYSLPCNVNFRYCTATDLPGVYDFTVNNPLPGATYTWKFGDGATATGAAVTHGYTTAGNYEVCVEMYNPQTGQSCKKCTEICVKEVSPCSVDFLATVRFGNRIVRFSAQTGSLPVASYFWDFGDGTTSSAGPFTTHGYSQNGRYTVCLTVKYENGCEARHCKEIVVNDNTQPVDIKTSSTAPPVLQVPPGDLPSQLKDIPKPAAGVKISPNPTSGSTVTATIDAATAGTCRYVIYDAQGKPALTGSKGLAQGVQNIQLSVKELQPGKYWIEFSNSRQQLRTSFVKL